MFQISRNIINAALTGILLIYLQPSLAYNSCPVGFQLTETTYGQKLCYSIKSPETFDNKFDNCTGNMFTMSWYGKLKLEKPDGSIWTDYKSLYLGGPFIDWSLTNETGKMLETTFEVEIHAQYSRDEALCVVIDPVKNLTAVRCDEKHYRYCIIDVYTTEIDDMPTDDCEDDDEDYWRYWSPRAACLLPIENDVGPFRATWSEAKKICKKHKGSLLNHGWRYNNDPLLNKYPVSTELLYPLGVEFNLKSYKFMYSTEYDKSEVPPLEAGVVKNKNLIVELNVTLGVVSDGVWQFVNSATRFSNIICEKPVKLRTVKMNMYIEEDNQIVLRVDDSTLTRSDILCFTDSGRYYPNEVSFERKHKNKYILKPFGQPGNGYYWCTHTDTRRFDKSESKQVLYIRDKRYMSNFYAVKIVLPEQYTLDRISSLLETWIRNIQDYVFYTNKYLEEFGDFPDSYNNNTIKDYARTRSKTEFFKVKASLKRLYLDSRSVLLHVNLTSVWKPVQPGIWNGMYLKYMRPVSSCRLPSGKVIENGDTSNGKDCNVYKCEGDYNEGLSLVITKQEKCFTPISRNVTVYVYGDQSDPDSESSEEQDTTTGNVEMPQIIQLTTSYFEPTFVDNRPTTRPPKPTPPPTTTEITTETPTTEPPTEIPTTTPTPENVISSLESLLNKSQIVVEDINDTMSQVNDLLHDAQDQDIPGRLLLLLDELGAKIDLNGAPAAGDVRPNVALVVAQAAPGAPVSGLRIAQADHSAFTPDAFHILSEVNDTYLESEASEAVVSLPQSVAQSSRRISFVVYRNDRAFNSSAAVNSRVLSIKVENLTHFDQGETVDIHLRPLGAAERGTRRACAYWQFAADASGRWATDGCRLRADGPAGLLDVCQCDHLTHFAEVLVARPAFPPAHEAALEHLSTAGAAASLAGLLGVALTAALFRSWRRDFSNKIWLQLSAAVALQCAAFLVVRVARFTGEEAACVATGVVLHFAVLASFCWMLVAAVVAYRRLVRVFSRDASHKLLRAAAFAWGAPALVAGGVLAAAPASYRQPYAEPAPAGAFCYPSGLARWLATYAPLALMLLVNWTLFVLIVRSVFASRNNITRHGADTNETMRCLSVSCMLVFLFGLPWVFGLFAFNLVAAYLFTVLATFQGLVLFLFFVVGNKKTRSLWLDRLGVRRSRKLPVTSSTYTQRSTAPAAPPDARLAVPRSLHSADNSRFS